MDSLLDLENVVIGDDQCLEPPTHTSLSPSPPLSHTEHASSAAAGGGGGGGGDGQQMLALFDNSCAKANGATPSPPPAAAAAGSRDTDDPLICQLCQQLLVRPRLLHCLHVFCERCIQRRYEESEDAACAVACPHCAASTRLDERGAAALPLDWVAQSQCDMQRIVDAVAASSSAAGTALSSASSAHDLSPPSPPQSQSLLVCSVCAGKSATGRCRDCVVFTCDACQPLHLLQCCRHRVVSLQSLARDRHSDPLPVHRPVTCTQHADLTCHHYCQHCMVLLCDMCVMDSLHPAPAHSVKRIADIDQLEWSDFLSAVEDAKSRLRQLDVSSGGTAASATSDATGSTSSVQSALAALQLSEQTALSAIERRTQLLHAAVDGAATAARATCRQLHQQQRQQLVATGERVQLARATLARALQHADRLLELANCTELLAIKRTVLTRIDECCRTVATRAHDTTAATTAGGGALLFSCPADHRVEEAITLLMGHFQDDNTVTGTTTHPATNTPANGAATGGGAAAAATGGGGALFQSFGGVSGALATAGASQLPVTVSTHSPLRATSSASSLYQRQTLASSSSPLHTLSSAQYTSAATAATAAGGGGGGSGSVGSIAPSPFSLQSVSSATISPVDTDDLSAPAQLLGAGETGTSHHHHHHQQQQQLQHPGYNRMSNGCGGGDSVSAAGVGMALAGAAAAARLGACSDSVLAANLLPGAVSPTLMQQQQQQQQASLYSRLYQQQQQQQQQSQQQQQQQLPQNEFARAVMQQQRRQLQLQRQLANRSTSGGYDGTSSLLTGLSGDMTLARSLSSGYAEGLANGLGSALTPSGPLQQHQQQLTAGCLDSGLASASLQQPSSASFVLSSQLDFIGGSGGGGSGSGSTAGGGGGGGAGGGGVNAASQMALQNIKALAQLGAATATDPAAAGSLLSAALAPGDMSLCRSLQQQQQLSCSITGPVCGLGSLHSPVSPLLSSDALTAQLTQAALNGPGGGGGGGGGGGALSPVLRAAVSPTGSMHIRSKFGQMGQAPGHFNSPHGFCLGVDEEVVVADTNNHRIQVFDKSGVHKYMFGLPGKDEGMLWYPRKVAVNRQTGNFVVCDRGSERSRMQVFNRGGFFLKKISIRYIDIVAGLAILSNGHIVVVDSVTPTVFVLSEGGNIIHFFDCSSCMREPSDIAVVGDNYYICDFKNHCVVVLDASGTFLRRLGNESVTNFPNGIDVSDAGDVLVGDSHGNKFHVTVFSASDDAVTEFECPQVKVSRCCGLKLTSEGYIITIAKNNHHVLVLDTLYIS